MRDATFFRFAARIADAFQDLYGAHGVGDNVYAIAGFDVIFKDLADLFKIKLPVEQIEVPTDDRGKHFESEGYDSMLAAIKWQMALGTWGWVRRDGDYDRIPRKIEAIKWVRTHYRVNLLTGKKAVEQAARDLISRNATINFHGEPLTGGLS